MGMTHQSPATIVLPNYRMLKLVQQKVAYWQWPHMTATNHRMVSCITVIYFLATGGSNLRGNDTLEYTGAPGEIPRLAVVRFHLHPRVTAAMLRDNRVLLKIQGNRAGWVFRSNAATTIDSSLFFDGKNRMNCQQIAVNLALADLRTLGSKTVKWAFTRSDAD